MRFTRSAKAQVVLGATLIVTATSAYAGNGSGHAQGIDSNGVQGIDSNGVAGIDSNGALGIDSNGALGIDAGGVQVLMGQVDRVDVANGVFHSMGQVVMASRDVLFGLRVGNFVSVNGSVVGPGWLYADTISVSPAEYVPGATEVFVSGMLSSVDYPAGTARLGGLTIDFTASLAVGAAPSGAMWRFSGTRPSIDGVMVSDFSGAMQ